MIVAFIMTILMGHLRTEVLDNMAMEKNTKSSKAMIKITINKELTTLFQHVKMQTVILLEDEILFIMKVKMEVTVKNKIKTFEMYCKCSIYETGK
jgi:hypothetical protein